MNFDNSRSHEMLEAAQARGDKDTLRAFLWLGLMTLIRTCPKGAIAQDPSAIAFWQHTADQMLRQLCSQTETEAFLLGPMEAAARILGDDIGDIYKSKR